MIVAHARCPVRCAWASLVRTLSAKPSHEAQTATQRPSVRRLRSEALTVPVYLASDGSVTSILRSRHARRVLATMRTRSEIATILAKDAASTPRPETSSRTAAYRWGCSVSVPVTRARKSSIRTLRARAAAIVALLLGRAVHHHVVVAHAALGRGRVVHACQLDADLGHFASQPLLVARGAHVEAGRRHDRRALTDMRRPASRTGRRSGRLARRAHGVSPARSRGRRQSR